MKIINNTTEDVLDLSAAPSTLFFFGLAGSGKSFIGDLIARKARWHVYHADDDLTDEMLQALNNKQPFTNVMRDTFFDIITKKILRLQKAYGKLVITQAVYKQRHRDYLLSYIAGMDMIMVDASDQQILQRINQREQGIGVQSAAALRQDFEQPDANTKVIVNDGDQQRIIRQLNQMYRKR